MKYKYKPYIIIVIVGLLALATFTSCDNYSRVLNENWGIKITKTSKIEYECQAKESTFGDGSRFHCISLDEEDDLDDIGFKLVGKDYDAIQERVNTLVNELQMEKKYLHQNIGYYFIKSKGTGNTADKLYLLLSKDKKVLYILEDFY